MKSVTSDAELIEKFRTSFKKAFGLSDVHYDVDQQLKVGNSVFWRVYGIGRDSGLSH